ncbi:MAG TPA: M48 family metalloprotease [Tepidisphaeraceae bacterium]|jgi:predicted Zn-dependent protease
MPNNITKTLSLLWLLILMPLLSVGCTVADNTVIAQADTMNKQLSPAVMNDAQLQNYLQSVGNRIIAAAKELDAQRVGPKSHFQEDSSWMFGQDMKFHFVNSKALNAFTTGGEHMYIYGQLFQECQSEDELAAVMAHEYAHVYCRHVGKGMKRQYTTLAAAAALAGAGYVAGGKEQGAQYAALGATAGGAGAQFLNMGFTRKDEDEADKYGFMFYTRAGWDPAKFDDFFQHMIDKGYDKTPAMMSDHPTLASRVESTQRRTSELPPNARNWQKPPIANARQFAALKSHAAAAARNLPDDTTLANSQQLLQALPRSCIFPAPPADEVQARQSLADRADQAQRRQRKTAQ